MRTIDAVYEAWQEEQYRHVEPEEIDAAYRYFRRLLTRVRDENLAQDLWDTMTTCQQRAAEIAFKEGYKMGYRLRDEMEGRT